MPNKNNTQGSELERTVTRLLACERAPEPKVCFIPHEWEEKDGRLQVEIDTKKYAGFFEKIKRHYQKFNVGYDGLMEMHINSRLAKCGVPRGKSIREKYDFAFNYNHNDGMLTMQVQKKMV